MKEFPILSVEGNYITSKIGDITLGYEIFLPEEFSLSKEQLLESSSIWSNIICSVPDNTILHKQDIFTDSNFAPTLDDSKSFLETLSIHSLSGRKIQTQRTFLYFTLSSNVSLKRSSLFSSLCSGRIVPQNITVESIQKFEDQLKLVELTFNQHNIAFRKLERHDYVGDIRQPGLYDRLLNLNFSDTPVTYDLSITNAHLKVGNNEVKAIGITNAEYVPEEANYAKLLSQQSPTPYEFFVDSLFPIAHQIKFPHIINQYIYIESQSVIRSELDRRMKNLSAFRLLSSENSENSDAIQIFLDQTARQELKIVKAAINVLFWDSNPNVLKNKHLQVLNAFKNITGVNPKVHSINTPQIFWASIPGAASEYPYEELFITDHLTASCYITKTGTTYSANSGVLLTDRICGKPIRVDLNDPKKVENKNKVIFGPSGSGKSFFMNHYLRSSYEDNAHIIILDAGNSYLPLCNVIREESNGKDGKYFTYTNESPLSFNPFYTYNREYDIEKIDSLKNLIICLAFGQDSLSKAEDSHISTAIESYVGYIKANPSIFPCFNSFYEYLNLEFRDYIKDKKILQSNFDLDNITQILARYAEGGSMEHLLNATEELDLYHNRFVVFELDSIKDNFELFSIVTIMIMDLYMSKLRSLPEHMRRIIAMDEAWKVISVERTAQFIKYLYKTVRKHNGEAISITQEIDDIVNNEIVKSSVIRNSDLKILLDHRKYSSSFNIIEETLSIGGYQSVQVLSLNNQLRPGPRYKEAAFIFSGKVSETYAYGIEVSAYEAICYSTNKDERAELLRLVERTGSWRKAIIEYVTQKQKK